MGYLSCQECGKCLSKYRIKFCSDRCRRARYYKSKKERLSDKDKYLRSRLSAIRARAKNRGLEFDLSFEQLERLFSLPCEYCGDRAETVGRKDDDKGYTFSNCVPACKRCDTVKCQYLTYEQMKQVAKLFF